MALLEFFSGMAGRAAANAQSARDTEPSPKAAPAPIIPSHTHASYSLAHQQRKADKSEERNEEMKDVSTERKGDSPSSIQVVPQD